MRERPRLPDAPRGDASLYEKPPSVDRLGHDRRARHRGCRGRARARGGAFAPRDRCLRSARSSLKFSELRHGLRGHGGRRHVRHHHPARGASAGHHGHGILVLLVIVPDDGVAQSALDDHGSRGGGPRRVGRDARRRFKSRGGRRTRPRNAPTDVRRPAREPARRESGVRHRRGRRALPETASGLRRGVPPLGGLRRGALRPKGLEDAAVHDSRGRDREHRRRRGPLPPRGGGPRPVRRGRDLRGGRRDGRGAVPRSRVHARGAQTDGPVPAAQGLALEDV
mmetsp:Transcript_1800/g.5315  ORF Transcript_1800/g.5315 Transcript_1800/m.5315 type:complete len:281 (+) Transcript_1800:198-1040(+)